MGLNNCLGRLKIHLPSEGSKTVVKEILKVFRKATGNQVYTGSHCQLNLNRFLNPNIWWEDLIQHLQRLLPQTNETRIDPKYIELIFFSIANICLHFVVRNFKIGICTGYSLRPNGPGARTISRIMIGPKPLNEPISFLGEWLISPYPIVHCLFGITHAWNNVPSRWLGIALEVSLLGNLLEAETSSKATTTPLPPFPMR